MHARGRTALLLLATATAALAAAAFASAASAGPFLSRAGGCDSGTTANGVTTIPIKVVKQGEIVVPVVNMCFAGKGPYPMTLDTGAAFTVITTRLAKELGLKADGPSIPAEGAGCQTTTRAYALESASVGGIELEGSSILAVGAPGEKGGGEQLNGSLGADVLSRFGSVKIDFKNETLVLGGEEEGPRFRKVSDPPPVPPALLGRKPKLTVPMRVEAGLLGVRQTVKVGVGSTKPRPWLIDTGSTASVIDPETVRRAGLKATGRVQQTVTYCSVVNVPEYRAPTLTVSSGKLRPQTIGSFDAGSGREAGILGAYSLWQFGSVVFDWPGGKLLLGVG
jgi:predicted aspartyl protease